MKKSKSEVALMIVEICLIATLALFLILNIIFTTRPIRFVDRYYYNNSWHYAYYYRSLLSKMMEVPLLTIIFSSISLLVAPLIFILRKKKFIKFICMFFFIAASGLALAAGIVGVGDYNIDEAIPLIVFGGVEILITIAYFILVLIFGLVSSSSSSSSSPSKALKCLDALKKEGLLTEEEYQAKKELLNKQKEEENEVDPNICPCCGKRKHPKDKFCSECGYKFENEPVSTVSTEVITPLTPLGKVAQVFFYIGAIATCCTVIGLCWALPMIHIYKRDRDTKGKHSIAFKVCTIIFISQVAGVLMLVDYKH